MINSNPMSYDVGWFGLAYHGLYVVERPRTLGYIRLKNGRRIYSAKPILGPAIGVSVLIDNCMPVVTETLDDPDAELWNVAIASGGWPYLRAYPFEYRTRIMRRRDLASGEFCWVTPNTIMAGRLSLSSESIYVTVPYDEARPFRLEIAHSEHGVPMDVLDNSNIGVTVLDISPDGHRFLIMIRDQKKDENLFVAEITVSNKFTQASVTVVAGYDIVAPREDSAVGELLESKVIVISREDGSVQHLDSDAASDYQWPEYTKYNYTAGSSSATATAESVIGAWYTDSGQVELVRVRKTSTNHISAGTPVRQPAPRDNLWVSPALEETAYSVSIMAGNKETGTLSITYVIDNTSPPIVTRRLDSSAGEYFESSDPREYNSNYLHTVLRATTWTAPNHLAMQIIIGTTHYDIGTMEISARNLSDKLYVPLILIRARPDKYVEYIAGDAITPKGVDIGVKKSGNVYGGIVSEPDYDPDIAEIVRLFLRGAYNPITGEVERNRTDGAEYAWV